MLESVCGVSDPDTCLPFECSTDVFIYLVLQPWPFLLSLLSLSPLSLTFLRLCCSLCKSTCVDACLGLVLKMPALPLWCADWTGSSPVAPLRPQHPFLPELIIQSDQLALASVIICAFSNFHFVIDAGWLALGMDSFVNAVKRELLLTAVFFFVSFVLLDMSSSVWMSPVLVCRFLCFYLFSEALGGPHHLAFIPVLLSVT